MKKRIPPRKKKGKGTHYAYLGGGAVFRQVTKIYNLDHLRSEARRALIHDLISRHGECLAILPPGFEVDCDLDKLETFLEGDL